MNLKDCELIDFPTIMNSKGNLSIIEGKKHIPFEIKRIYYLYNIPEGTTRGGHAHKRLYQFFISVNGSLNVILDDGLERKEIHLNREYYGLYVPPMIWRELYNFSLGSICLVIASEYYDEKDYIRDYETFKKIKLNL